MGKIDNNILEVETNFENKVEKTLFVLQDGVFIVSNQGLDVTVRIKELVFMYIKSKRNHFKCFC